MKPRIHIEKDRSNVAYCGAKGGVPMFDPRATNPAALAELVTCEKCRREYGGRERPQIEGAINDRVS